MFVVTFVVLFPLELIGETMILFDMVLAGFVCYRLSMRLSLTSQPTSNGISKVMFIVSLRIVEDHILPILIY